MASKNRLRPLARAVMRTQSDERLVALARDGHDAAFEEIVRRYRPPLVAFASAYVAADLAEDVVQESFENSWKSLLRTEGEINLKPWLYTIVRNRALNAKRDTRVHEPVDEQLAGWRTPPDVVLERDQLERVLAAVGALAPAQRRALVASALEGRTHDQIAAALETSPASVRGLIHRARSSVRNGVGLLLPLPLVRAISELAGDPTAAEAALGGATIGIAGAGAGAGAAAGGGLTTKAVTIVAVATVAAGTGVVVEESLREENRTASAVSAGPRDRNQDASPSGDANDAGTANPGVGEPGTPSSSGPGPSEREDDEDHSGPGPSGEDRDDDDGIDNSGPGSLNSGPGSVNSGDDDGIESGDDSSGSGSSGSGSSGSDSSGSGSSGSEDEFELDDSDSSGSGSGELELESDSSGSGS